MVERAAVAHAVAAARAGRADRARWSCSPCRPRRRCRRCRRASRSCAIIAAFMPEPHILLTVVQPAPSGRPAPSAAWRAGAWPSPAGSTQPMRTSSTLSGRDAGPLDRRLDRARAELRRRHILEVAKKAAHRRAGRANDDNRVDGHDFRSLARASFHSPRRGPLPNARPASPPSLLGDERAAGSIVEGKKRADRLGGARRSASLSGIFSFRLGARGLGGKKTELTANRSPLACELIYSQLWARA